MPRDFGSSSLVALPRLSASGASALGEALLTRAQSRPLPEFLQLSSNRLVAAVEDLRSALTERIGSLPGGDADVREFDQRLDGAWSATRALVSAWTRLPVAPSADGTVVEPPQPAAARALELVLFGDGLRFTQVASELEWSESLTRLRAVESQGLEQHFETLGAGAFLAALRFHHRAYGDAQGLSEVQDSGSEPVRVREALDTFLDALRRYVVRVTAYADDDTEAATELATHLLAPITTWDTSRGSGSSESEEMGGSGETGSGDAAGPAVAGGAAEVQA